MKQFFILIISFLLMGYPLKVDFAQTSQPDTLKAISKKEAELKIKIAANIDSALTNIVNAKTETVQRKIAPKPKTKTHYKIITDTLYRDTCMGQVDHYIFEKVPLVIAKPEAVPVKKLKWYQFKALRDQKKKNKSK